MYRTSPVHAGFTIFTAPEHVPEGMRTSISDLSADIVAAEQAGHIDSYVLAAKYCHKFVNIHPFVDGNGRTCRLILNVLVFKYTGMLCVLGENEQAVQNYLSVAVRGSESDQAWKDADEVETAFMKSPWGELAFFILRQVTKGLDIEWTVS
ncbi:unnamed protein product [Aureobasidium vineae]|uniref:Fido domain-containing protein n=1 Tax=Aureobasidium vineae TaxID=2773715 RepID=A0A9N8JEG4_9PEZI|nr:unnamed protein product [Aureobasidium vineae]